MLKKAALTAILSTAIVSQLHAATVVIELQRGRNAQGLATPGAFRIIATVAGGDNGGLSGYGADIIGNITSMDHQSPRDASAETSTMEGPTGFTLGRSADNQNFIAGFQDTTNPDVIPIYGLGQYASSFALQGITVAGVFEPASKAWGAPLLLAAGTYTGAPPTWNQNGPNRTANVFVNTTGLAVRQPETLVLFIFPEPTSAVLIGFSLLALTAFRRRLS